MNIFSWLVGRSSNRSAAMSLYKQGLKRTRKLDPQGAMDAFTSVVELAGVPDDVKAMALYNRALLYAGMGHTEKAATDLKAVMAMPTPLRSIKLATKRRLDRMQRQHDASAAALPSSRAAK